MKAKFYATNITGKHLLIKAFSMKQVADYLGEPVRKVRTWTSICGPAVQQADVDLTENSSQQSAEEV